MDFVTHLPRTSKEHYAVWVIVDQLTKSAHFLVVWMTFTMEEFYRLYMSQPDSQSDPIGGSEPSSGCKTIYWDSLPDFFFKAELVPVGMAHIL